MKMELNMNYIGFLLKDKSMKDLNTRMFAWYFIKSKVSFWLH
jgi:hypothetical protein